ncbi:hypothetical protein KDL67_05570 [bacterium]|nr:hypothetical protein [bacterium]
MRQLLVIGLLFLVAPMADAATWTVQPDGNGDVPTIWEAMLAASDGDEIVLGDGVFTGEGNRDFIFFRSVTLRSASGSAARCVIDCEGSPGAPHRAFTLQDFDDWARVKSLTIRNGYAGGPGSEGPFGGAVRCKQGAAVHFDHCRFENCHAETAGGAVSADHAGELKFRDCVFAGNSSDDFAAAVHGMSTTCLLLGCTLTGNVGGAGQAHIVALAGTSRPWPQRVVDCTFRGNTGGALWVEGGGLEMSGTVFEGDPRAGVVVSSTVGQPVVVEDCAIHDVEDASPLSLSSDTPAGQPYAELVVSRCVLANNAGGDRTLILRGAAAHVSDVTLWGNGAFYALGLMGNSSSMRAVVERVIVADPSGQQSALYSTPSSTLSLRCSNFQHGWAGYAESWLGVGGNIDADPLFCDPAGGDFTLHANSPCVAAVNGCGTMGALDVGCELLAVEDASFGAVKALY